jgi:acyl carrier protein
MNTQHNLEWLEMTLNTKFKSTISKITEDTLIEDLGIDSLDLVELQLEYENDFKVTLSDTTEEIRTVKDLLNLLENNG